MTTHQLRATRETVRGSFTHEIEPVLTIEPGDTVQFQTLDAGWNGMPRDFDGSALPPLDKEDPERDAHHAITGPVFIKGARAGMTLEVRINALKPSDQGWTASGGFPTPINNYLDISECERVTATWQINDVTRTASNQFGHTVAIQPFPGLLGMPPAGPGLHSTVPPRNCGGNMDCKEFTVGSSVFLPIPVDGAYFYVGDGHAAQGDGEVSGTAIECCMDLVDLTFFVHHDLALTAPRASTPGGWVCLGLDRDLNQAFLKSLENTVSLVQELYQVDRQQALVLASTSASFRISQAVNQVQGVHSILPHGAIKG